MQIGRLTFSYPWWKKASFVVLIFLSLSIFYFGKILALNKYADEIALAKQLSVEYEERYADVPWTYEPNPGVRVLNSVNEKLSADPFWRLAMILRGFWVAFMVLAFPYIRVNQPKT